MSGVTETGQMFRALTDKSPLAIYIYSGEEQKADYINPTYLRLFGYTLDEIPTAADWWQRAYPDPAYRAEVSAEWYRRAAYAVETNTQFEPMECRVRCKDGTDKTIAWGFSSVGAQNVAWGIDITARKQAEEAKKRARELTLDLIESNPFGIYRVRIFPPDQWQKGAWEESAKAPYEVEMVSDRLCEILGVTREAFDANPGILNDLVHPEDKSSFSKAHEEAMSNPTTFSWEGRIACGGLTRWVHFVSRARKQDNGDVVWTGSVMDITDRKKLEAVQLQLYDAEQKARCAAEETAEIRNRFLGIAAHDLRNPLVLIGMHAELLERNIADGRISDKSLAALTRIRRAVDRMHNLVTTYLDASALSSGKMQLSLKPTDFAAFLRDFKDRYQPLIDAAKLHFDIRVPDGLPRLNIDAARMEQAIDNIISNAIKFSPQGSSIRLTASQCQAGVAIAIKDEGPGISKEYMAIIFQDFVTLHSVPRAGAQGAGLGLYICRLIVEAHGGGLAVNSSPDAGSEFRITLPGRVNE